MRILAGALKGRRLVTPRGPATRPTTDQVRLALLDALAPWLEGARVLDLFAGAGGVGLEALSRGAAHATFVERDARAVAALRRNIAALALEGSARVLREDALRALERLAGEGERFEIAFLDPPYETDLAAATLVALGAGPVTGPAGVVVAQHRTKQPPAPEIGVLRAYRTRRFGETTLTFFRAGG
ncbi:MAG: 16S rRNA (guanine(966)-N(2))-methyltransferase RsmD [Candidatus Rokubacteria bacterium 13_1_40CM_69_27]|nr:MAG: 16S rRNA (guanine(966)-N(2))-methyltransferase RsmD [Candidatus Rokubacteria bacterium 13_1_40CM_69_27]OLC32030.1 MAG: 16S rRNA (guanine(966)-N(2))-methyltransferase RsmD [Candidatus Rokubacteria bacterium 13_1_40CM_4_69_5]OLE38292.1 MAG: 16S rRNA (guanine(966)-N(2))-methyltransferase RsmD [Candidatus Rokubacteria bacterium 13_1_20CM_2_70_7]